MFKTENRRRKSAAKKINSEAVDKAIDSYKKLMKGILEDNVYLTNEMFLQYEKEADKSANDIFKQNCSAGDNKFKESFELLFEKKLKENREEFKELNQTKCEKVEHNTEKLMDSSVDDYNTRMDNLMESFTSLEQLSESHEEVKEKSKDTFLHSCNYKDYNFLNKYLEQFEENLNKSLESSKKNFVERIERFHNLFTAKLIEAKQFYIQVIGFHIIKNNYSTFYRKCINNSLEMSSLMKN